MLEKLPNHFDVVLAARRERVVPFVLAAKEMARLSQATLGVKSDVQGELRFSLFENRLPSVTLSAAVQVTLVCERTLAEYVHDLSAQVQLIFTDEYDLECQDGQEVLSVEEMDENPRVWIEDSLLLALPLVPVQPGTHPVNYQIGELAEVETEKVNPFAGLKAMLQKE
jgi:uncharacterized protein